MLKFTVCTPLRQLKPIGLTGSQDKQTCYTINIKKLYLKHLTDNITSRQLSNQMSLNTTLSIYTRLWCTVNQWNYTFQMLYITVKTFTDLASISKKTIYTLSKKISALCSSSSSVQMSQHVQITHMDFYVYWSLSYELNRKYNKTRAVGMCPNIIINVMINVIHHH